MSELNYIHSEEAFEAAEAALQSANGALSMAADGVGMALQVLNSDGKAGGGLRTPLGGTVLEMTSRFNAALTEAAGETKALYGRVCTAHLALQMRDNPSDGQLLSMTEMRMESIKAEGREQYVLQQTMQGVDAQTAMDAWDQMDAEGRIEVNMLDNTAYITRPDDFGAAADAMQEAVQDLIDQGAAVEMDIPPHLQPGVNAEGDGMVVEDIELVGGPPSLLDINPGMDRVDDLLGGVVDSIFD